MARRGVKTIETKYSFDNLSFADLLGDPRVISRAELKKRMNNLLGYKKFEIEDGDEEDMLTFYTIERFTCRSRKTHEERVFKNVRHYDDSVLDPYVDVYNELKQSLGKLDINEMDDTGCERLAAAVMEAVFEDYKHGYYKSKSKDPVRKKVGETEMDYAVWRMEHGIGSNLPFLPDVVDIRAGLEAQVDKHWRFQE